MKKLALGILSVLLFSPLAARADTWRFVVMGDDRVDVKDANADNIKTGIHEKVLKPLLDAAAAEKPEFVLFTGDLVSGVAGKVTTPFDQQLIAWQGLVAGRGLSFLPVRGNHETIAGAGNDALSIWKTWFTAFPDKPTGINFFPGEECLSYSYTAAKDPTVAVIGLDQYSTPHHVNLDKLKERIESLEKSGVKTMFVFAHEMAFTCGSHPDADNMASDKKSRDDFMDLLQQHNIRFFFAGHDHMFDWMLIHKKTWPAGAEVHQIVGGTSGAPFYPDGGYTGDKDFELTRIAHKDFQDGRPGSNYGYVVVEIKDGEIASVNFRQVDVPNP